MSKNRPLVVLNILLYLLASIATLHFMFYAFTEGISYFQNAFTVIPALLTMIIPIYLFFALNVLIRYKDKEKLFKRLFIHSIVLGSISFVSFVMLFVSIFVEYGGNIIGHQYTSYFPLDFMIYSLLALGLCIACLCASINELKRLKLGLEEVKDTNPTLEEVKSEDTLAENVEVVETKEETLEAKEEVVSKTEENIKEEYPTNKFDCPIPLPNKSKAVQVIYAVFAVIYLLFSMYFFAQGLIGFFIVDLLRPINLLGSFVIVFLCLFPAILVFIYFFGYLSRPIERREKFYFRHLIYTFSFLILMLILFIVQYSINSQFISESLQSFFPVDFAISKNIGPILLFTLGFVPVIYAGVIFLLRYLKGKK